MTPPSTALRTPLLGVGCPGSCFVGLDRSLSAEDGTTTPACKACPSPKSRPMTSARSASAVWRASPDSSSATGRPPRTVPLDHVPPRHTGPRPEPYAVDQPPPGPGRRPSRLPPPGRRRLHPGPWNAAGSIRGRERFRQRSRTTAGSLLCLRADEPTAPQATFDTRPWPCLSQATPSPLRSRCLPKPGAPVGDASASPVVELPPGDEAPLTAETRSEVPVLPSSAVGGRGVTVAVGRDRLRVVRRDLRAGETE